MKIIDRNIILERTKKVISTITHRYLVIKTLTAVTFFFIAFLFFIPLSFEKNDIWKVFVSVYGVIVVLFCLSLIFEYLSKTLRLQLDSEVRTYSMIASLNTFFGLIIPLAYINYVTAWVISSMSRMHFYGSIICQIRMEIVHNYYENGVYTQIGNLLSILVIMTFVLLIFGGFIEKLVQRK